MQAQNGLSEVGKRSCQTIHLSSRIIGKDSNYRASNLLRTRKCLCDRVFEKLSVVWFDPKNVFNAFVTEAVLLPTLEGIDVLRNVAARPQFVHSEPSFMNI